jgi:hypothetical protein
VPNRFLAHFQATGELPTGKVFRDSSRAHWGLGSRSNPHLLALDEMLDEHQRCERGTNTELRSLCSIGEQITLYLENIPGRRSANRVAACEDLREITILRIRACRDEILARANARSARNRERWKTAIQKVRDIVTDRGLAGPKIAGVPLKTMDGAYWSEMHGTHAAGTNYRPEAGNYHPLWMGDVASNERYLFQWLTNVLDMDAGTAGSVFYIPQYERIRYLVYFRHGLAYQCVFDGSGARADLPRQLLHSDRFKGIYAIAGDGCLYFEPTGHSQAVLNHVSFTRGKPVICAGNMKFDHGRIVFVDNGSGHYRPTTENLVHGVRQLNRLTEDNLLASAELEIHDHVSGKSCGSRDFPDGLRR